MVLRDGVICLAEGASERELWPLPDAGWHAENLLAAVAGAWAHGLADALLQDGLRTLPAC